MSLEGRADAELLILKAVRRVVRRAGPLAPDTFFQRSTIGDVLRGLPVPHHDPELWWRAVVDQIQNNLVKEGLWADGLSVSWLQHHAGEPWSSVRDYVLGRSIRVDE